MKILVRVKTGSREDCVTREPDGSYVVSVRARAEGGEANEAVCRMIAEYFGVPKYSVKIKSGHGARVKTLTIG